MQVVKRDGSLQEFDSNKIVEAISKAFNACCPDENRDVINAMVSDMHYGIELLLKKFKML